MLFLVFIYITYGRKQADFSLLRSRVADPVGFYPDPDLTFKKKPDLDPNFVKKNWIRIQPSKKSMNLDPYPT